VSSVIFMNAARAWQRCRDEYEAHVMAAYARAERETNGFLLNQAGRAAGVDPVSLFTGPWLRARRYASEELLEHWLVYPRVSFAEFEEQWVQGGGLWGSELAA